MSIVFDLETSGLPRRLGFDEYHHPSLTESYQESRIVQIGYIVMDEKNREVKRYSSIVIPEGFVIANERYHNIPQEKALKEGKPLVDVLKTFVQDAKTCHTLIGHNIKFDFNILMSELYRAGLTDLIKELEKKKLYCTMWEGKKKFKMNKVPKLVELFSYLYEGETWSQRHDALDDAEYCMRCYVRMLNV
jgi:DNA polymerase III subunit alpha